VTGNKSQYYCVAGNQEWVFQYNNYQVLNVSLPDLFSLALWCFTKSTDDLRATKPCS